MLGIMEIPENQSCTSVPQQWHKPRGASIEPEQAIKCLFVKALTDKGGKAPNQGLLTFDPPLTLFLSCRKLFNQVENMLH